MNFSESELAPSSIGCLVDERPLLTPAIVRPYIIAIVLHRGAVREEEIYAALVPHCTQLDLNTGVLASLNGDWLDDQTRLEEITEFVLGDMVAKSLLRYNESEEIWVADESSLVKWVTYACNLDGQLPKHITRDEPKGTSRQD